VAFSSWAFVLLGSPVLLAYGLVYALPWYFYVLLPFYFVGFVLLPGSAGAILCLLIVNWIPRQRKQVLAVAAVALLVAVVAGIAQVSQAMKRSYMSRNEVSLLLGRTSFTRSPLVPSHWMTRGIQAMARHDAAEAGYYLGLIWGNGLFLYL